MRIRAILTLAGACLLTGAMVAPSVSASPQVVFARFEKDSKSKKKRSKAKGKKEEAKEGPSRLRKNVKLKPKGLRWGMSLKALSSLYVEVLKDEYRPLYKRVQPGPKMKALDEELDRKKGLIKRNHLKFGTTPTGIDYTALKGEYSYRNKESKTHIMQRSGVERHFFFFDDKLWKVYDEYKLSKRGPLGSSFKIAVKKITKSLKTAPQMVDAGTGEGEPRFNEARWADGSTVIRLVDRGYENVVGVVYADQSVWENLDRYRPNKPEDPNKIDSSVLDVTRDPKKDDKDKDDKKKK